MKAIAKTAATQQNATGMHSPGNGGSVVYRINARRLVPRASERRSKMIAFGYYGGKFSHLDFILPLLPTRFTHFCEPFGGSAAVLINRPPAPVETYNDLDGEVVNFFECLRDHSDTWIRAGKFKPAIAARKGRERMPAALLRNHGQSLHSRL